MALNAMFSRFPLFTIAVVLVFAGPAFGASARLNYRYYCAPCHGLEGKGNGPNATNTQPVKPRDHTSAPEMGKLTDAELMDVIKLGGVATNRSRMMPPFEKTLTDSEIRELKDYLRALCKCKAK